MKITMRKRNVKKQFWINQVEAKELERKAKLAGLNESDFLRMLKNAYYENNSQRKTWSRIL